MSIRYVFSCAGDGVVQIRSAEGGEYTNFPANDIIGFRHNTTCIVTCVELGGVLIGPLGMSWNSANGFIHLIHVVVGAELLRLGAQLECLLWEPELVLVKLFYLVRHGATLRRPYACRRT